MRPNFFLTILAAITLSGCLISEEPLFPPSEAAKQILANNYIATDGKSPVGKLTLSENDGQYTIAVSTDKKATANPKVGRTFRLFPTQIDNHPIEKGLGPLKYFWVQIEKTDQTGFEYELFGISTRASGKKGIVFRWGLWTFIDNKAFVSGLEKLAASSAGQMNCRHGDKMLCSVGNRIFFKRISELMVETNFMPFRAYVPQ